jgi:hypothetical protein
MAKDKASPPVDGQRPKPVEDSRNRTGEEHMIASRAIGGDENSLHRQGRAPAGLTLAKVLPIARQAESGARTRPYCRLFGQFCYQL